MKHFRWPQVIAFLFVMSAGFGSAAEVCTEPVQTLQGLFAGRPDEEYGACVYRGIPFARPPVGERRLKRPEPPVPHEGVFQAVEFGPACLQKEDLLMGGKAARYGEDCLYLNVWRPAKPGRFPVMVWIYGGGFVGGAGSFDIYNGAHLAARNGVVVVTFNYRLAALGFLALPELKAEDPEHSTGNYGLLDQIRALEWVRDNIAAFGGDPENVTIFGQSAGGMSVCALLVSPGARGLFHRAMMMSGPCRLMTEEAAGVEKSRRFAAELGCGGPEAVSCLRAKPAAAFVKKAPNDLFAGGVAWSPTVDGAVLPQMPVQMIQKGEYQRVPVIIGTTRDELRLYTITIPALGMWSRPMVNRLMKLLTGPRYNELMALYDYNDYRRPIDLAFAFGNEMVFETPLFLMAEAMAGNNPVFIYQFDWNDTRFPHKMGAFHAIDVPFVFGAFHPDLDLAKLLADKKTYDKYAYLGYIMMDYVTNFAKTGNPNGPSLPPWPEYSREKRERLHFNTEITSRPLSERQIARYEWFARHPQQEILAGSLPKRLSRKK